MTHPSIEESLEQTLQALDYGAQEAALVGALRATAHALTAASADDFNASLVREYRCLLTELTAQLLDKADTDTFDDLLASFSEHDA